MNRSQGADDDTGKRFSSISFSESESYNRIQTSHQPTFKLLDSIANGMLSTEQSAFAFFDSKALLQLNLWAGASHWKRAPTTHGPKPKEKPQSTVNPKAKKETYLISFRDLPIPEDLFRQPSSSTVLSLSKAMQAKHTANENLLPIDAAIEKRQLFGLFLRRNLTLRAGVSTNSGKTVGFASEVQSYDWDDGSTGCNDNDNDCFAADNDSDDEFCAPIIDGVRKVDKVVVGHATVAKKVDVKRLKSELWEELSDCFAATTERDACDIDPTSEERTDTDTKNRILSFKATVQNLEQAKSQPDATLPFYFICLLHLANENGLRLESKGLDDLVIYSDSYSTPA